MPEGEEAVDPEPPVDKEPPMTCWNGHLPHMTEAQLTQAMEAYYRAAYNQAWQWAWQAPTNPLSDALFTDPWAATKEPPVRTEPRRTTSLKPARGGDKTGAIDVEFARVR